MSAVEAGHRVLEPPAAPGAARLDLRLPRAHYGFNSCRMLPPFPWLSVRTGVRSSFSGAGIR